VSSSYGGSTSWSAAITNNQTSKEDAIGRAASSIVISVMALSASFIAAIIVTILVTREMELVDIETDEAEA
jgi:hypothetical protein